jgi:hypothetical protein
LTAAALFGVVLVILATQFVSLGLPGEMMARQQQQQFTCGIGSASEAGRQRRRPAGEGA